MKAFLDPDVTVLLPDGTRRRLLDYLLPSALLMLAALMLMVSMFLPFSSLLVAANQIAQVGIRVGVFAAGHAFLDGSLQDARQGYADFRHG